MDISKHKVETKCSCGRKHSTTLQDVINRKTIKCSCGVSIQLKDDKGSVRKGISDINNAFKNFENSFKKIR
ncbi:hypothetical protein D3C72_1644490 [compost metagenome]